MTKIIGIVPARMKASRFYGKPLHNILDRPMLEHVYLRAKNLKIGQILLSQLVMKKLSNSLIFIIFPQF